MKLKYLISSMVLVYALGQGCRASFHSADQEKTQDGDSYSGGSPGEGDAVPGAPGQGDANPELDPTKNPIDGVKVDPNSSNVDPTQPGSSANVDPVDGSKGKIFLTVSLPMPSIKMGENKIQATAKLNTQTEPPRVRWSIAGPMGQMAIGSIDQNGVYTSPKIIDKSFPISVIATLIADPNIKGMAPLTVEPLVDTNPNKPILTVTTPVDTVTAGENKVPATARVNTSMTPPDVTWKIVAPSDITNPGTIDSNGVYTSPKDATKEFPLTIVATLKSDPTVVGIKTIIVQPQVIMKPFLTVTTPSPEIRAGGQKMQATAKLSSQTTPPIVSWSIMGPKIDNGSIDANGVYTSPRLTDKEFPVVITATLNSDPSISGSTTLRVLPNDQIFARCTRGNTVFPILADVYQINNTAVKIPNFGNPAEARKITTVCMDNYAVAPRNFDAGFPDVPGLLEWFALNTKTQVVIPQDGNYTFYLNSDDGSRLYIDGALVIDNDGQHQAQSPDPQDSPNSGQKEATIYLAKGNHDLRLDYFQGPKYRIALELKWKKPGSNEIVYVPRMNFK